MPAAIIGFAGEDYINRVLHGDSDTVRLAIAGFLVVGAVGLLIADRLGHAPARAVRLRFGSALIIGFSQALALLPGISRSGATITAGLALGLKREAAARFSFLLATPITLGAGLYGSRHLLTEAHSGAEWLAIGGGFVAATLAGHARHRLPAGLAADPLGGDLQLLPLRLCRPGGRARGSGALTHHNL